MVEVKFCDEIAMGVDPNFVAYRSQHPSCLLWPLASQPVPGFNLTSGLCEDPMYFMLAFKYASGGSGEAAWYSCCFYRGLPSLKDFHRQFNHSKTSLEGRGVAFNKQNIIPQLLPAQKPPVIIFSALACMLKVKFQLIFSFCKKLRQFFWEKLESLGSTWSNP
jgi:hypothetical protein